MKRYAVIALMVSLILSLTVLHAAAQDGRHLDLKSTAEVEREVANDQGEKEKVLEPAEKVFPGETVVFSTVYKNIGQDPADDIIITNPVPEHMIYVGGSAEGEGTVAIFSVDGGQTYNSPESLKVTGEDGTQRQARPDDYTHIRWALKAPVTPGGTGKVSFRATLK